MVVLEFKSTSFRVNRSSRLLFPTPLSPMSTTASHAIKHRKSGVVSNLRSNVVVWDGEKLTLEEIVVLILVPCHCRRGWEGGEGRKLR